jgi:hypothetical protein
MPDQPLLLILTIDGPQYPGRDQDAAPIASRYAEQDPAR